jgi:PIN domain nuclease of toxin-antitoxin system
MNILLDTQTLIWSLESEQLLTSMAKTAILDADVVYISPINFYEIAIKLAIGKNPGLNRSLGAIMAEAQQSGFVWLPVQANHLEAYLQLPLLDHHRDPFDRLILATALADDLTVISSDHNFPLYSPLVQTIW